MTLAQALRGECSVTHKIDSEHAPSDVGVLKTSGHIRSVLHEAALGLGMTETRLKNCEYLRTGLHDLD